MFTLNLSPGLPLPKILLGLFPAKTSLQSILIFPVSSHAHVVLVLPFDGGPSPCYIRDLLIRTRRATGNVDMSLNH